MTMITFAAVLTPMRLSVGAGLFAISVVGNISYFSFGLLAPASGYLADRFGSRPVLLVGIVAMAAASIAVAAARNIYTLAAALAALGLAAALYHPAGLSLIARRVGAVEKAMAYHGIFGTVGLALGPLATGAIAATVGWRWAYVWLGVALAALAATFALYGRGVAGSPRPRARDVPLPSRTILPALLLFYVFAIMNGFIFHGATTFLPTHLGAVKGLFVGNAATTAVLLVGIGGQYVGGFLSSRWRYELFLMSAMLTCGAALYLLGVLGGSLLFAPALAYGFAHFSTQPAANALVSRLASARRQGVAFGVGFFLSFGVGSLGTGAVGFIGERYELAAAFRLLGYLGWACVIVLAALWLVRRRAAAAAAEGYAGPAVPP